MSLQHFVRLRPHLFIAQRNERIHTHGTTGREQRRHHGSRYYHDWCDSEREWIRRFDAE